MSDRRCNHCGGRHDYGWEAMLCDERQGRDTPGMDYYERAVLLNPYRPVSSSQENP